MDTRSNIQQNFLLIDTLKPTSFGGFNVTPKVFPKSTSLILNMDSPESPISISPLDEFTLFNGMDIVSCTKKLNRKEGKHGKTNQEQKDQKELDVNVKNKEIGTKVIKKRDKEVHVKVVETRDPEVFVGTWSTILVKLLDPTNHTLSSSHVNIMVVTGECDSDIKEHSVVSCEIQDANDQVSVRFLPYKVGQCRFLVKPKNSDLEFRESSFKVEVYGNNPQMSFSETGSDWPVTVAFKPVEKCVYVAFNHHVSKFSEDGEFIKVVLRDKHAYINDLAVDPIRSRLVIGVSGWKEARGYKFRFQEVRLYTMSGSHMWTLGKDQPLLFGVPILHVTFDTEGHVIVAGYKSVGLCNKVTGIIQRQITLNQLITPSRVCCMPDGGCAIAEATKGAVQIYDINWQLKDQFLVLDPQGKPVKGISGLSVDPFGNILVSSCTNEEVYIYKSDGKLTAIIESDWDCAKWPLDITTTNDGHFFVADHGNACAKKYKYL